MVTLMNANLLTCQRKQVGQLGELWQVLGSWGSVRGAAGLGESAGVGGEHPQENPPPHPLFPAPLAGIISCLAPNPDRSGLLAAGAYSGVAALYDALSRSLVCLLEGHTGGVTQAGPRAGRCAVAHHSASQRSAVWRAMLGGSPGWGQGGSSRSALSSAAK